MQHVHYNTQSWKKMSNIGGDKNIFTMRRCVELILMGNYGILNYIKEEVGVI